VIADARSKQVIHRKIDETNLSWSRLDLNYKPFLSFEPQLGGYCYDTPKKSHIILELRLKIIYKHLRSSTHKSAFYKGQKCEGLHKTQNGKWKVYQKHDSVDFQVKTLFDTQKILMLLGNQDQK
jgi:hypothetical protein